MDHSVENKGNNSLLNSIGCYIANTDLFIRIWGKFNKLLKMKMIFGLRWALKLIDPLKNANRKFDLITIFT